MPWTALIAANVLIALISLAGVVSTHDALFVLCAVLSSAAAFTLNEMRKWSNVMGVQ